MDCAYCFCVAIECDPPAFFVNGKIIGNGTAYGFNLSFLCDAGHILVGSAVRTCQSDGQWSGIEPVCDGKHPLFVYLLFVLRRSLYSEVLRRSWHTSQWYARLE